MIGNHLLHARHHACKPLQKLRKEKIQLFEKKLQKTLEVNEFIHVYAVKFGYKI